MLSSPMKNRLTPMNLIFFISQLKSLNLFLIPGVKLDGQWGTWTGCSDLIIFYNLKISNRLSVIKSVNKFFENILSICFSSLVSSDRFLNLKHQFVFLFAFLKFFLKLEENVKLSLFYYLDSIIFIFINFSRW